MRRFFVVAAVLAVSGLSAAPIVDTVVAAGGSVGGAPSCGIRWGSQRKQANAVTAPSITDLRAGRHGCFDRLVVDLGPNVPGQAGGNVSGYTVRYVSQVTEDGSGEVVPLRGGAFLSIVMIARAHDDDGEPTYQPADRRRAVDVSGFTTFRQVSFLGTFEGISQIGLGVRARLPFRVLVLSGPGTGSRLVIDVAHRW